MSSIIKSTFREIKNSLGRYIAIFAIIALGVGFFAGLRLCRPTLVCTAETYYTEQNFYDYKALSSIGYSKSSISDLNTTNVHIDEGANFEDLLITENGNDIVLRFHSVTNEVNKLKLISGRLPSANNECVLDADYFSDDMLGQAIVLSDNNSESSIGALSEKEFTVVGLATSPLYISKERGTTSLGGGSIAAFAFVSEDCFTADYYKEIYIVSEHSQEPYSDEYKAWISEHKSSVTAALEALALSRYDELVSETQGEIDLNKKQLDDSQALLQSQKNAAIQQVKDQFAAVGIPATESNPQYVAALDEINKSFAEAEREITEGYAELEKAQQGVNAIESPSVFVLTREENAGYAAFGQDSTIIENISVVFPIFFFLVAALVCVTTMTRMVDEQRTQIGVFKALGYSKMQIAGKYLFYSGSAGLLGSVLGFFIGTVGIPMIFWGAYSTVYNFADTLDYVFDSMMYVLSLLIAVLCTAGVTLLCCYKELADVPASILRPKAPKNGKRIVLERCKGLWERISFLQKVSLRNVFRYKQRFFLMILGICGCTALLVTGFGVRDSIQNVTDYQYGEIVLYDAEIAFSESLREDDKSSFVAKNEGTVEDIVFLSDCNADIIAKGGSKNVKISAVLDGDMAKHLHLTAKKQDIAYPGENEIVICKGVAEKLDIAVGDTVTLTNDNFDRLEVTVSGVMDNYIGTYVFISESTMTEFCGEAPVNAAYVNFKENADVNKSAATLLGNDSVSYVTLNEDMRESIRLFLWLIFCIKSRSMIKTRNFCGRPSRKIRRCLNPWSFLKKSSIIQ